VSPVSPSPTEVDILKEKLQQSQDESSNLEIALKKSIYAKAELNNQIEQLTDDVRKYEELYARAKGVAQALGKAVSILTSEIQNG
jgi:chromosome segregation ATPase